MSSDFFESYHQEIYQSRWKALRKALLTPELQAARWNFFAGGEKERLEHQMLHGLEPSSWDSLRQSYLLTPDTKIVPQKTSQNVFDFYIMDRASLVAARLLPVSQGNRILDVCAAPGGKSLILSESLSEEGELIANDTSESRRERMKKIFQNYIPNEIRQRFWIKGWEGAQYGLRQENSFDGILVDAPCSGERHVLMDSKALKEWSPQRSKTLSQRQFSLLCGAHLALKPEGHLVYSTCSLNPNENDGVVKKFMKRRGDDLELDSMSEEEKQGWFEGAERTDFGFQFLPDRCGYGPIYIARFRKR